MAATPHIEAFGEAPDGSTISRVFLTSRDVSVSVMSWGASIQDFRLSGVDHSLVLGAPNAEAYFGPMRYFGAIVGPVANRIAGGRMAVEGKVFELECNENGVNSLHGGSDGFSNRNWTLETADGRSVTFSLRHPDGLGGFPGNIKASVRYTLEDDGTLALEIKGETDRETWFGPAFHGYWNLDGGPDLSGHRMMVMAQAYLQLNESKIPMGDPVPVEGSDFDYRVLKRLAKDLDHNFCLGRTQGQMTLACFVEAGDLRLELETTEVGLQVYTGANLNTSPTPGHRGAPYVPNAGIALEPQFWPDTPNHPNYPSSALQPGQTYRQLSRFCVTRIR